MTAKLKTAVLGATGYSGLELTRLLGRHPRTDAPLLLRRSAETADSNGHGLDLPHVPGNGSGRGDRTLQPFSWSALEQHGVELLFLATPHAISRDLRLQRRQRSDRRRTHRARRLRFARIECGPDPLGCSGRKPWLLRDFGHSRARSLAIEWHCRS